MPLTIAACSTAMDCSKRSCCAAAGARFLERISSGLPWLRATRISRAGPGRAAGRHRALRSRAAAGRPQDRRDARHRSARLSPARDAKPRASSLRSTGLTAASRRRPGRPHRLVPHAARPQSGTRRHQASQPARKRAGARGVARWRSDESLLLEIGTAVVAAPRPTCSCARRAAGDTRARRAASRASCARAFRAWRRARRRRLPSAPMAAVELAAAIVAVHHQCADRVGPCASRGRALARGPDRRGVHAWLASA